MKKIILGLIALSSVSVFANDPCADVALKAASALEAVNSELKGMTATLGSAIKTDQTIDSKSARLSYSVDIQRSDGSEYYYLIQTRKAQRENCFVETVAYWYTE